MHDELGLTGWLFIALGWLVAGLGVAWLFGGIAQAGRSERRNRSVPSAVGLYTNRDEEPAPAPGVLDLDHPAKL